MVKLVYYNNLAKGMSTLRRDQSDSRFTIKQILLGLGEYTTQFFTINNLQQVKHKSFEKSVIKY